MELHITGLYGINKSNYVRSKNMLIMLNPTAEDIKDMEDVIKQNYRVHIFITSPYIFTEEFNAAFDNLTDWAKYYIHVPKVIKDLKIIAEDAIRPLREHKEIKVILEKKGPLFATPCIRGGHFPIKVNYNDNAIEINLRLGVSSYGSYFLNNNGAIQTTPMAINPALFKDQIIENFKKATPELILKSFRDDNDIWDYINKNGEWSVKEE